MPLPRFRLRTLMIAVAVVAVLFAIAIQEPLLAFLALIALVLTIPQTILVMVLARRSDRESAPDPPELK